MTLFDRLRVAPEGTHHVSDNNVAAYENRFDEVLAFHQVSDDLQAAPVRLAEKAWHINPEGAAIYPIRYDRTFGFYCGLAAVTHEKNWFHINAAGLPIYSQRYAFAGNFQNNIAVVCDENGYYFHITLQGTPLYTSKWKYCGDFREGIAVVQADSGLSAHITVEGKILNDKWLLDLDVFHKGYARAKDNKGWHHIDKKGCSVYPQRYAAVEPFYNGCARVETFLSELLIINEYGEEIRYLRSHQVDNFSSLSASLVGYWSTFTIAAAVKLGIFENLPNSIEVLAAKTATIESRLKRLLNALGELGLIALSDSRWQCLPKGQYLTESNDLSLATASVEYQNELLTPWYNLVDILKGNTSQEDIFKKVASDSFATEHHHRMLESYALKDYSSLIGLLDVQKHDIVFDAAGGSGSLARLVKEKFPSSNVLLGDLLEVVKQSTLTHKCSFDLFLNWPISANKILLSRVLHDWNDLQVIQILSNAATALKHGGQIYVFEMLLEETSYSGSLCDLHLLCVTGGQERTLEHYTRLAAKAGLKVKQVFNNGNLVSVLCLENKE
ncbi:MAG: hypothetical protein ACJA2D_001637 [Pseudohongiellaceae bacterium]|jgi:hypothetical protein